MISHVTNLYKEFHPLIVIPTALVIGILITLGIKIAMYEPPQKIVPVEVTSKNHNLNIRIMKVMEWAYLAGQEDALTNDIRVRNNKGIWEYIVSPWDGCKDTLDCVPKFFKDRAGCQGIDCIPPHFLP